MQTTPRPSSRPSLSLRPCAPPPRILVVDDDPALLPILRHAVAGIPGGGEVDQVPDAIQAIHRLWAGSYGLVILDYLLAEATTGLVLASWCARHYPSRVAMMSAFPVAPELARAGLEGCPFLPKPFSLHRLRAFLHRALDAGRLGSKGRRRGRD